MGKIYLKISFKKPEIAFINPKNIKKYAISLEK
jgi:hypothetical protein